METPTRTLHRLTSYEPGREWDEPVDDPRVLQDLEVNDLDRLPGSTSATRRRCLAARSHATYRPRRPRPSPCWPVPRASPWSNPTWDSSHGCSTCPPGSCARRSGRTRPGCSAPRGRREDASRSRCTSPCPKARGCPGVHWYDPLDHALVRIGPPPRGRAPAVVVTGVPWRTGWRYRERGFRHVYWDAGTMLSQLLAAADSAGLSAQLHTRFPDAAVTALVGADGVHSGLSPSSRSARGHRARRDRRGDDGRGRRGGGRVPARDERPAVRRRRGAGAAVGARRPGRRAGRRRRPIETVVLARGSQRRMDPTRGVSESLLRVP